MFIACYAYTHSPMPILVIIILTVGIVCAVVALMLIKGPNLLPKRIVTEPILAVADMLFQQRLDLRSFVGDSVNLYSGQDAEAMASRAQKIENALNEMRHQLKVAIERAMPYQKVKKEAQFHNLCTVAVQTLENAINDQALILHDAKVISAVVAKLNIAQGVLTNGVMTKYIDEHDDQSARSVQQYIEGDITDSLKEVRQTATDCVIETAEAQSVVRGIYKMVSTLIDSYTVMARLLDSDILGYRNAVYNAPQISTLFDFGSYDTLLARRVHQSPEELVIGDVRRAAF